MKKVMIAAALASIVSGSALAAVTTPGGTIHFKGFITEDGCSVSTSANEPVSLGTVQKSAFTTSGDVSTKVPFKIELTNCPASFITAAVTFKGTESSTAGVLALDTTTSTAEGVGIRISDDKGKDVDINSASDPYALTAGGGSTTLNFDAQYYALVDNADITAGQADGIVDFDMTYN
ncbi:fimbrial protein [Klebsiella aerogenes]|nr:fimbrial protein [Klebsiella aerogenes]